MGLLRPPLEKGEEATQPTSALSGAGTGCGRFLLTCTSLMTSSHSKVLDSFARALQRWEADPGLLVVRRGGEAHGQPDLRRRQRHRICASQKARLLDCLPQQPRNQH